MEVGALEEEVGEGCGVQSEDDVWFIGTFQGGELSG